MAANLGEVVPVVVEKGLLLRSEPYRRYVAAQECFFCRLQGYSQCAHENVGKGMALKVCDSRSFPACGPHWGMPGCHYLFDNLVEYTRDEAREVGALHVQAMQDRAMADGWDMATLKQTKDVTV